MLNMKNNVSKKTKSLYLIIPIEVHKFLKNTANDQQRSMTDIMLNLIEKYKEKLDKRP